MKQYQIILALNHINARDLSVRFLIDSLIVYQTPSLKEVDNKFEEIINSLSHKGLIFYRWSPKRANIHINNMLSITLTKIIVWT